MQSYFPKYDLSSRIQHTKFSADFKSPSIRMDAINSPETQTSFKQVLGETVGNLNSEMNAPDNLLKDLMMGKSNVDVHDVMTAISKSEISVNVATQVVGKVITAYDRVSQISV